MVVFIIISLLPHPLQVIVDILNTMRNCLVELNFVITLFFLITTTLSDSEEDIADTESDESSEYDYDDEYDDDDDLQMYSPSPVPKSGGILTF